jgi:hypothetical protein
VLNAHLEDFLDVGVVKAIEDMAPLFAVTH